ncbi:MAG: hypothetical protein AAF417_17245 [Pseudomonadota bacterium]
MRTGLRLEVRAKSDLKIRMSDAPANPDRVWDAGLSDDDIVALIACADGPAGIEPADDAVYFTVGSLRTTVEDSKLGPPKSASEGAERDRTWPATVPSRSGTVLSVSDDKLVVMMDEDESRAARKQTYTLRGKSVYVSPGDRFDAGATILAGAPADAADLGVYLSSVYDPLRDVLSSNDVDRYAAAKALRFRLDLPEREATTSLEGLLEHEEEDRIALEAPGTAAFLGSPRGEDRIAEFIWENDSRPDLRMESVFILTELGSSRFSEEQLVGIADAEQFQGDELRQAAVWGLGKFGLRSYDELLRFIDDPDEDVALHAIAGFGPDAPADVVGHLVADLVAGEPRRAPAASEVLRLLATEHVVTSLIGAARAQGGARNWILATLGRLPPSLVRNHLQDTELLRQLEPMFLQAEGAHWLSSEAIATDIAFLTKQNIS